MFLLFFIKFDFQLRLLSGPIPTVILNHDKIFTVSLSLHLILLRNLLEWSEKWAFAFVSLLPKIYLDFIS